MNAGLMCQYVEYIANRLMTQFNYTTKFKDVKNPFPFMDKMALQNQTSFFDKRVSEYSRNDTNVESNEPINFEDEF